MKPKTRVIIELLTVFTLVVYNYLFLDDTCWMYLTFFVMGFIVPFIFVSETFTADAIRAKLGVFKKTFIQQIIFGILIGAGIAAICSLLLYTAYTILPVHVTVKRMMWVGKPAARIVNILIQALAAAFFEELFFRSYLDDRFSRLISNDYLRILLIALIFAASQIPEALPYFARYQNLGKQQRDTMTIVYTLNTFGTGFIFSFAMGLCRTKIKNFTLLSCVIGHWAVNLVNQLVIEMSVLPS